MEELQKHQSEKIELLLQQNEEKEEKLREENRDKEQKLEAEHERAVATLMEQNEVQEALLIAKHEEEKRAVRKAEELDAERNAPSAPSHPSIPECPVGFNQTKYFLTSWTRCALKRWPRQLESSSVGTAISSVRLASQSQKKNQDLISLPS